MKGIVRLRMRRHCLLPVHLIISLFPWSCMKKDLAYFLANSKDTQGIPILVYLTL
jgi:hypothetical protein